MHGPEGRARREEHSSPSSDMTKENEEQNLLPVFLQNLKKREYLSDGLLTFSEASQICVNKVCTEIFPQKKKSVQP